MRDAPRAQPVLPPASMGLRGCGCPLGRHQTERSMITPSAGDMEKLYPLEDWDRDLGLWFSRGALSTADFPKVAAYFDKVQAGNAKKEENCRRMWMTLAFLQSFLPDLAQGGAVIMSPSEKTVLPPALVTALYRAFMSPVAAANARAITVPLILQVVKEQKDWNEDRT